jgi:hypothetical protein
MNLKPTTDIQRKPLEVVLGKINSQDPDESQRAGLSLIREAKEYGLNVRDYLTLAVDVRASNKEANGMKYNPYMLGEGRFMTGYEAAISELNLPFKNDFSQGVTLQAAADTFSSRAGTRALFPEVIDDMLQWATRQEFLENASNLVAQSRTIKGNELITQAIFDDQNPSGGSPIAELANIPVQTLTSSDRSVSFFKHGSAIRTSYEFERRVSLDVLTPYASRIARNLEISKVKQATNLLISGDGVHNAADTVAITSYKNGDIAGGKTLKDNYIALMDFLVQRAKAGTPVDTIVGNLDMYLELFLMFTPVTGNKSVSEHLQDKGAPTVSLNLPLMKGVNFELSSSMPAGKLMCYSKADTLEELIEANSQISESESAVRNQSITYVKTETSGYRLIYGDTRMILDVTV